MKSRAKLAILRGVVVVSALVIGGCSSRPLSDGSKIERVNTEKTAEIGLPVDVPFDKNPELVALGNSVKEMGGAIRVYKNVLPGALPNDPTPKSPESVDGPLQVAIDFHGIPIKDAQVKQLAQSPGFSQVTVINASQTAITDESLAHIAKAERLEFITISGTGVTDRGLEHLMGHKRLALIFLDRFSDGRGISQQAEERLLRSLSSAPSIDR